MTWYRKRQRSIAIERAEIESDQEDKKVEEEYLIEIS